MSRVSHMKTIVLIAVIAILVSGLSAPVLAKQSTPTPAPQASPVVSPVHISPLPAGNGTINVTPGMPDIPGHGRIGNLHSAPALIKNITQKVKKQVSDVRVIQARSIAEGRINLIISQLTLYERLVANSGVDATQQADIKAIVEDNIAWFRQQTEDLEAAEDLATVQSLAAEADRQAAALKVSIKKEAGTMACDRLDERIAAARNASIGIADKIAALNAAGNNTAFAEQKLADYDAHVAAAAGYSGAARDAFEGITAATVDSGFDDGYRYIAQADREMTQAYADLKSVYLWYLQASRTK